MVRKDCVAFKIKAWESVASKWQDQGSFPRRKCYASNFKPSLPFLLQQCYTLNRFPLASIRFIACASQPRECNWLGWNLRPAQNFRRILRAHMSVYLARTRAVKKDLSYISILSSPSFLAKEKMVYWSRYGRCIWEELTAPVNFLI